MSVLSVYLAFSFQSSVDHRLLHSFPTRRSSDLSGIGTTAIQVARALGHTVYATAGSDERVEAINELGAIGINYHTQKFEEYIRVKIDKRGVDVIFDVVAC